MSGHVVSLKFPRYADTIVLDHNTPSGDFNAQSLTCVIRTDADMATDHLRQCIVATTGGDPEFVSSAINIRYKEWGTTVIGLINRHLDYRNYQPHVQGNQINVDFYRHASASRRTVTNAMNMLRGDAAAEQGHYLMISLDDMIQPYDHNFVDFAFSRLFDKTGEAERGYVGRPGHDGVEAQIAAIKKRVDEISQENGGQPIPIVFLEDNIRRAAMINWVFEQFDRHNVFDNAYIAGISTCFCSADAEERQKIQYDGIPIPVVATAAYNSKTSDVITPRDLFFDGFVVEVDGHIGRLPALFMDVSKRFKIVPEDQFAFKAGVAKANIDFCTGLANDLGVDIPLSWMPHGETIAIATGHSIDTPVVDVMKDFLPISTTLAPSLYGPPAPAAFSLSLRNTRRAAA